MAHTAEKKRVMETTSYVSAANILVVLEVPTPDSIAFDMPFNPSDAADTVPTMFRNWLFDGDNNVDALLGTGQLFTYRRQSESDIEQATFAGPIPVWAYRLRHHFLGGPGTLRFTSSETLFEKITSDGAATAQFISENYQFLFVCEEYRFGPTGESGYGKILEFCASQLVPRQVSIFPPLSLLYFLSNKQEMRDPALSELMLPSVLVPVASTLRKTACMAVKTLKQEFPDHSLKFDEALVAKVSNSCGGLGVVFFRCTKNKKGRNTWTAKLLGKALPDVVDEESPLKLGQLVQVQPFVEDLLLGEWRFYSYLQHHSTEKGLSNIYGVKTAMQSGTGDIRIVKLPNTYLHSQSKVLTKDDVRLIRTVCKSALDLLVGSNLPSWRGIRFLPFRFDCFFCGQDGKFYLNEIDLFPVAHTLLDDYNSCEDYIETLAKCTFDYIVEHSSTHASWSM
jgi:hypothetical protein